MEKKLNSIKHYYDIKNLSFNHTDKKFATRFNEIENKQFGNIWELKKIKYSF